MKGVLTNKDKTKLWLVEKLAKNKSTVSKWCTNDQQPTLETLFDIAELLDVKVSELFIGTRYY